MIRLAIFFLFLFALAAGFAWFADRPGEVIITWPWLGQQAKVSLLQAMILIVALVGIAMMIWWVVSGVIHSPEAFGRWRAGRRRDKGYNALSRGMIAIGSGDTNLARRMTKESGKLLENEPMVAMLDAQTALLEGKQDVAREKFESMLENEQTQLLGLRGLYLEAQKDSNEEAAAHFAKEANAIAPDANWATTGLLKSHALSGDWEAALALLDKNRTSGLFTKDEYNRKRAVILTALGLQLEDQDPDKAKGHALAAHKLAPSLAPTAVLAARLLMRLNDLRKAAKVLETAWKKEPHPEIAETYVGLRSGDSARDRLKRAETLSAKRAHHTEGQFAVAHAAIDAGEWATARKAMEAVLRSTPSEKACLLMADIEEGEHGDKGRVREWLARALTAPKDAIWTADGTSTEVWLPASPVTGEIDAFEWKVPVEEMNRGDKVVDYSALPPLPSASPDISDDDGPTTIEVAVAAASMSKMADKKDTPKENTMAHETIDALEEIPADDIELADNTAAVEEAEIIPESEDEAPASENLPDAPEDKEDVVMEDESVTPFKSKGLDQDGDGILDHRPDDPGIAEPKPKKRKNFFF